MGFTCILLQILYFTVGPSVSRQQIRLNIASSLYLRFIICPDFEIQPPSETLTDYNIADLGLYNIVLTCK